MRITAISNSRIPSATANSIQAMKVCNALVQNGHAVSLIVPSAGPRASSVELSRHYGIKSEFEVEWIPSRAGLRRLDFVLRAARLARVRKADLVYTWLPQTAAFEAWGRRPVVLEMHANVAGKYGAWWLRQVWRSQTTRLLVTTSALRSALERSTHMQFPTGAVQVAPNGVDLDRYQGLPNPTEARALLGLPEDFTAGFTGHFYSGRGIELLFGLSEALQDTSFLWVGGTPEAVAEWRRRLDGAGRNNVTLIGFVENSRLPLYQAAADVLLMPYSRHISSSSGQEISEVINPMKMFEYMAAERAIVSADVPVIREVLNEDCAVFCPPEDLQAWRITILKLAGDNKRRSALGANARRTVEKYTWQRREARALEGLVP